MNQWLNKIVCGDAIATMAEMPDESVDVIVTSPPYNLRNSTGNGLKSRSKSGKWVNAELVKGYTTTADDMPWDEYIAWQSDVMAEMFRLIKPTGAIFYNHKWRVQGGLYKRAAEDIIESFPLRQIVIWQRSGGLNFNPGYFLPTYEVIYIIAKPDFKLAPGMNKYGDVWKINQENNNPHPAPFPLEVPARCIMASETADIVLDPMCGSGTTCLAAKMLGRNYIGIEISEEYCRMAEDRIENATNS
jgi:site-specific DNA-methyltransferase (adenine-specific)